MANNMLQSISRLIGRILVYNICLKIESYNYYSYELATCFYTIMEKLKVNWARIMFDTLVMEPSTFLSYRAFLTHIFRKFKPDLAFESNVVKVFELGSGLGSLRKQKENGRKEKSELGLIIQAWERKWK